MAEDEITTASVGVVSTVDLLADEDVQGTVEIAAPVIHPSGQPGQVEAAPADTSYLPLASALSGEEATSPPALATTLRGTSSTGDQVDDSAASAVGNDVPAHTAATPQAMAEAPAQSLPDALDNAEGSAPQARVVESGTEVANLFDGNDEGAAIEMGDASTVAAAPPVSARAVAGKFDIEPGAISIPQEVLAIEHPAGPHAVLVVDLESRRSRERYPSELPPEPRPPLIVELTGEAQLFGRTIKSLCTDFDRYSSGMHGAFQKDEGTGAWHVRDMSDKGLKLNGRYIDRGDLRKLNDGAVLTFGLWSKLVFFQGHDGPLTPTEL